MGNISREVEMLETKLTAYGKVSRVIQKELRAAVFVSVKLEEFNAKIEYFRDLNLNQAFSYCPFPRHCKRYTECTWTDCAADQCDNGWAHEGY